MLETQRNKNRNVSFILLSALISCVFLYYIEQVVSVNYAIKTGLKLILFLSIPFFYIKRIEKSSLSKSLNLKTFEKKSLLIGTGYGIFFAAVLLITYAILGPYIDLDSIANELQTKLKVTPVNFLLVGAYITFGNSLLEEFFFRGYVFLNLYEMGKKKTAYAFSSLLFSLYHIVIFKTWFTLPLFLLALLGLVLVALFFNYMDTKSKNFFNSWISHIIADAAIIYIGLKMFKMI